MPPSGSPVLGSWAGLFLLILSFLSWSTPSHAFNESDITWIKYTDTNGETIWLEDNRKPALYTQDFGDCQGDSQINVTRFDAAYYQDNMTVIFHLAGNSALTNESLMLFIGVFAYGENRFDLTFNPCNANIYSMCPLNSSVPIEASGIIPVASSDVAGIPPLALSIPDFEGQAILRIFANSTQSQIGCYSAVVTNGATFSHPATVGTILGIFTLAALMSSVIVAVYGERVPEMRKHYAHSLPVFVVFSVFHHIFFTGALSMNWPSVLVAFWSNYAWSAGMIYSSKMQNSINQFIGSNRGNLSVVGAAASGAEANDLGGGFQVSQIYKRSLSLPLMIYEDVSSLVRPRALEHSFARRDLVNASSGFSWYGSPVRPGLPLPGNYSGFAGTLGAEKIPLSNAFLTGLLWLLALLACLAAVILMAKWGLEALCRAKMLNTQRLGLFRTHWLAFMTAAVLRTCFIAFFMMILLITFQFTLGGSAGITAIASICFAIFLIGMVGVTVYALYYRLRSTKYASASDRLHFERQKKLGFLPWYNVTRESQTKEQNEGRIFAASLPWWRIQFVSSDPERRSVHDDEDYIKKFGWLASRFRRSKWWFFSFWLLYEFVRACFYGGAAGHPLTQVFGLLAVECIALVTTVLIKPFEGNRLNLLMVYLLGFSKVSTLALSSAFDVRFSLDRILTTVIGIVIIVIQGSLTICLLVCIALGWISSYMSITRNREAFKPISWTKFRTRYFAHVDQKATDSPAPPPPPPSPKPEVPTEPYFKVASVRRQPKIEDEDEGNIRSGVEDIIGSESALPTVGPMRSRAPSRTQSITSRTSFSNLPYGARPHRASWSSRDFFSQQEDGQEGRQGLLAKMSDSSIQEMATRERASSLKSPTRTGTPVRTGGRTADIQVQKHRGQRVTMGTNVGKSDTMNINAEEGVMVEKPES